MTRLIFAAAAAALVGACAPAPSRPSADVITAAAGQAAPDAADFVRMAGAGDLYDIHSSQILLSGSQDEALRRFATMMIEHHTRPTATLTAAAQRAGLGPRLRLWIPQRRRCSVTCKQPRRRTRPAL